MAFQKTIDVDGSEVLKGILTAWPLNGPLFGIQLHYWMGYPFVLVKTDRKATREKKNVISIDAQLMANSRLYPL